MKKILLLALLISPMASADQFVNGYIRKDGTYVQPHFKSSPDGQTWNNYSAQGNANPYTGKAGTQQPATSYSYQPYQPPQPYQPYNPYSR